MPTETRAYCMGMEVTARRPLTDDERRELARAYATRWRGLYVAAVLVVALVVVAAAAALALAGREHWYSAARLMVPVALFFAAVPVLVFGGAAYSTAAAITPARGADAVVRCEGEADPAQWRSHGARARRFDVDGPLVAECPRSIELLMPGALLWRIDGERPASWLTLPVVELEVVDVDEQSVSAAAAPTERALTAAERAELAEKTNPVRAWLRLGGGALGCGLCVTVAGVWLPFARIPRDGYVATAAAILACVLAVVFVTTLRAWMRQRALRRDLARAVVTRRFAERGHGGAYRAAPGSRRAYDETLPSGIAWTTAGEPAPWRRT